MSKFFTTPYHHNLLKDTERLSAFYEALKNNYNNSTFDLGTGLGILSYFSAPYSSKILAIEKNKNTYICAKKNLKQFQNIKLINADILDFKFTNTADLIICEMLDTFLIDEEQVPILNKTLKYLNKEGTTIPYGVINIIQLISMSHPRLSYQDTDDNQFQKYTTLSNQKTFNKILFTKQIKPKISKNITIQATQKGLLNSIKLTTFTLITPKILCGPTKMFNPPLFLPINDEIILNKNDKIEINLTYTMGGGLDTIKTKINKIS